MSTASITARTRNMVQDTGRPFAATIPNIDGVSTIFELPYEALSQTAYPPTVILNGQVISDQATLAYWIDYKHGVIVFYTAPSPAGATLAIQGLAYNFFIDSEVSQAVSDAFNLHVADQDPLPVIDPVFGQYSINSNEELCVSLLAAVELLWMQATDAAQTIDVHTPEGVSIPASQRFQQILKQIDTLEEQYKEVAGTLGVGLWRIQVLNLRRVSLTTNRLVPIFREQEYNQPYTGFEPTAANPGDTVTIYGRYFTGATSVTFGGIASPYFSVQNDQTITAVVPTPPSMPFAGQIGVKTPEGIVLSTAQFVFGQPSPFIRYGPELVKIPIPPGK